MRVICKKSGLRGNIFITGFHGLGVTGYIAIKHLVEELAADYIGYIYEDEFPSVITYDKRILFPFRLYKKKNYVFLITEIGVPPHLINTFGKCVINFCKSAKIREIYIIGGLDNTLKHKGEIRYVKTSCYKRVISEKALEPGLQVVGPLASLLMHAEMNNLPALAILPYCYKQRPDPRAAAIAIEKLQELVELSVITKKLRDEAQDIEKKIESIMEQQKITSDSDGTMYR